MPHWKKDAFTLLLLMVISLGMSGLVIIWRGEELEGGYYRTIWVLPNRTYIDYHYTFWSLSFAFFKPVVLVWGWTKLGTRNRGWSLRNGIWLLFSLYWVSIRGAIAIQFHDALGLAWRELWPNVPLNLPLLEQKFYHAHSSIYLQAGIWIGLSLAIFNLIFAIRQIIPRKPNRIPPELACKIPDNLPTDLEPHEKSL